MVGSRKARCCHDCNLACLAKFRRKPKMLRFDGMPLEEASFLVRLKP